VPNLDQTLPLQRSDDTREDCRGCEGIG
jgi:hypothetical protein